MSETNSCQFASYIARILDNKQAKDIIILNISNVSILADYFVICSAETTTQVRALTSSVRDKIKELFARSPYAEESDLKNRWNLLDYGDVIVHIMHKEERQFYTLEKFWSHACTVDQEIWQNQSEDLKDKLI